MGERDRCRVKDANYSFAGSSFAENRRLRRCRPPAPYVSCMCLLSKFLSGSSPWRDRFPTDEELLLHNSRRSLGLDTDTIAWLYLFKLRPGEEPSLVFTMKKTNPADRFEWAMHPYAPRMLVTATCFSKGHIGLSVHETRDPENGGFPSRENFWGPAKGPRYIEVSSTEDYDTVANHFSEFFMSLRGPLLIWTPNDNRVSIVNLTLAGISCVV